MYVDICSNQNVGISDFAHIEKTVETHLCRYCKNIIDFDGIDMTIEIPL